MPKELREGGAAVCESCASWYKRHNQLMALERASLKYRVEQSLGHEIQEALIALSMDTPDVDIAISMIRRAQEAIARL